MDKVFTQAPQKQFEFDANVAGVFDDMLCRSIPFYKEVLALSADFALEYAKKDSVILDLGTSTGAMLLEIASKAKIPLRLYGIDNSASMLEFAQKKLDTYGIKANLICGDILQENFPKCDVIVANYTLQFIRPLERERLVQKIFNALNTGGVLICSEKVICENKTLDFKMIQYYLESKKKRGYSEFEISKKREALENVLIPYSENENKTMLKNAGFSHIQTLFCWVNFTTLIALKE